MGRADLRFDLQREPMRHILVTATVLAATVSPVRAQQLPTIQGMEQDDTLSGAI
jgi:hypothetical protein